MSKHFAYIRVSDRTQNEARQLDAIKDLQLDEIVVEKASGKNFIGREKYQAMKKQLRSGDRLTVLSIDRLGRNYTEISNEWDWLIKQGVAINVLDMPILNTQHASDDVTQKLIADIVLKLLSYVAEKERENTKVRQAQGIKAAKERGMKFGRPKLDVSELPKEFYKAANLLNKDEITPKEAINLSGLKRGTFYNYIKLIKAHQIL